VRTSSKRTIAAESARCGKWHVGWLVFGTDTFEQFDVVVAAALDRSADDGVPVAQEVADRRPLHAGLGGHFGHGRLGKAELDDAPLHGVDDLFSTDINLARAPHGHHLTGFLDNTVNHHID
jgi:hypothetical protein